MDLVTASELGAVAVDRMVRDRVVALLAPGFAVPLDLPVTPDDRARCLAASVPPHTVVSGLAGLWVHHGGARPTTLTLVGLRGLHRAPPDAHPRGWRVAFHSGGAASERSTSIAGVRVASRERCAADALRWDDLGCAFPAIVAALHAGHVDPAALGALAAMEDPRGAGAARMASAWSAIRVALG